MSIHMICIMSFFPIYLILHFLGKCSKAIHFPHVKKGLINFRKPVNAMQWLFMPVPRSSYEAA